MTKRAFAAAALAALLWSSGAAAYCRATTCDASDPTQRCQIDASSQCNLSGSPLRWAGSCITVDIQRDGAPQARISADAAEASLRRALGTWLGVDCGGAAPSLEVVIGQPISCGVPEYSTDHHNANVVMFREGTWPYEGSEDALGVTWLHFDEERSPGELWDADIEINAVSEPLSATTPQGGEVDLDSLLTHEIGHLLGLGHALERDSTMLAGYTAGSIDLRSLSSDDISGICAIYPPGREVASTSCEPRHGFSDVCAAEQPPFVEPETDPRPEPQPDNHVTSGCALSVTQPGAASAYLAATCCFWLLARRRRS